jgi:hypothetical protein
MRKTPVATVGFEDGRRGQSQGVLMTARSWNRPGNGLYPTEPPEEMQHC